MRHQRGIVPRLQEEDRRQDSSAQHAAREERIMLIEEQVKAGTEQMRQWFQPIETGPNMGENGRHEETRTPDLYRVNFELSRLKPFRSLAFPTLRTPKKPKNSLVLVTSW